MSEINFMHTDEGNIEFSDTLLLADPILKDSMFERSVIYIVEHRVNFSNDFVEASGEYSTFGYVLNKPSGKIVETVYNNDSEELSNWDYLKNKKIYIGGPIEQDKLIFVEFEWISDEKRYMCRSHLSIQNACDLAKDRKHVIPFVGFSIWENIQLELEIKNRAWINHKLRSDVFSNFDSETIWYKLMEEKSIWHKLKSALPHNPSNN